MQHTLGATGKQYDRPYIPRQYSAPVKVYNIACNMALAAEINAIRNSNARRNGSQADTLRLLLRLGIEQYNINQLAGVTTTAKAQEQAAIRRADAEAIAAERQAAKQRKRGGQTVAPAVSAMLIGDIQPAGGQPVPGYTQPHHQDRQAAGIRHGQEQAAIDPPQGSGYAANNTASPAPGAPPLLTITPAGTVLWQGVEYSRREIDDVLLALHTANPMFCAGMRGALNKARERRNIRE